jgi:hypothetical protein
MSAPVACVPARLNVHNRNKTQKDGSSVHPFLPFRGAAVPFVKEKRPPILLCDGRMPGALQEELSFYGSVLPLPPYEKLPVPVCGHPDLLVFYDGETLYTFLDYYRAHLPLFESLPCRVRPLALEAGAYPFDLPLDVLLFGGALIGREEFIPLELSEGRRVVSVKQGYAKCSSLVFGGCLVTADGGIARAGRVLGGEVCQICPGFIALPGYDCGFIGGASGVVGQEVLFFGDPTRHPDGERILSLISASGFEWKGLSDLPLTDYGGLTVIF